jgi:4-amino-4-deoxy-L-arabinose transferase-like glycosyltransferase
MSNEKMDLFMGIKSILSPGTFTDKAKCVLIFVLAIFLRFIHLYQIYKTPLLSPDYVPDTLPFMIIAEKIIEGNFFYTIPLNMNVLYSLYLVPFVLLFQESVIAAVTAQLIIDAVSAVIVYLIGRRIFGVKTGLLAGIIYAVYAPLIWFAAAPIGESITIFFLLISFYFLIKAMDLKQHNIYYYLAGICSGIASLGRPNVIISAILVMAGIVLYNYRDKANYHSIVRYALGIIFILLPFSLNNFFLEKSFSPYPAKGGIHFYIGNHYSAKGIYELIPGMSNRPYLYMDEVQSVASSNAGRELNANQADAYWYQRGMDFFTKNPVEAIKLMGIKVLLFMNNKELATNLDYEFSQEFSNVLKYVIIPPGFLLALAIMGIIVIPNNDRKTVLLKLFLAGLIISTIVFFVSDRLRIVCFPFIILLSAQYILMLYDFICRRKEIRITFAVLATIVLIIIGSLPLNIFQIKTDNTTSFAYNQYGIYLLNRNKADEAIGEFQKAIILNSLNPEPYYYLSTIYNKKKQYQVALEFKNKAIKFGYKE